MLFAQFGGANLASLKLPGMVPADIMQRESDCLYLHQHHSDCLPLHCRLWRRLHRNQQPLIRLRKRG